MTKIPSQFSILSPSFLFLTEPLSSFNLRFSFSSHLRRVTLPRSHFPVVVFTKSRPCRLHPQSVPIDGLPLLPIVDLPSLPEMMQQPRSTIQAKYSDRDRVFPKMKTNFGDDYVFQITSKYSFSLLQISIRFIKLFRNHFHLMYFFVMQRKIGRSWRFLQMQNKLIGILVRFQQLLLNFHFFRIDSGDFVDLMCFFSYFCLNFLTGSSIIKWYDILPNLSLKSSTHDLDLY